jgi:hypothetical protein
VQDVRVGAGLDVIHRRGAVMGALTVRPFSLFAWDNDNFGVGATIPIGGPSGLSAGAGGIVVYRTDGVIGTHLNFLGRVSYCGERVCLSFAHVSHGRVFGFDKGQANSGLNFVFLEYRLR